MPWTQLALISFVDCIIIVPYCRAVKASSCNPGTVVSPLCYQKGKSFKANIALTVIGLADKPSPFKPQPKPLLPFLVMLLAGLIGANNLLSLLMVTIFPISCVISASKASELDELSMTPILLEGKNLNPMLVLQGRQEGPFLSTVVRSIFMPFAFSALMLFLIVKFGKKLVNRPQLRPDLSQPW